MSASRNVCLRPVADIAYPGFAPHHDWLTGGRRLMFDRRKLSPPEGWRKMWWELGVVTLGVLIALIAEQSVSSWRRPAEVRSFRSAIDEELGVNLAAYDFRLGQG